MATDARREQYLELAAGLTGTEARAALIVLLGLGDPARRWALEAMAIAAPGMAGRLRDAKGDLRISAGAAETGGAAVHGG